MKTLDYKNMGDDKLKEIILDINSKSDTLMTRISQLKPNNPSKERKSELNSIISEYAILKKMLKEIYKYSQLIRNECLDDTFYSNYFCPAIIECYIHCNAKSNCTNSTELYNSLSDINDYSTHYLSDV